MKTQTEIRESFWTHYSAEYGQERRSSKRQNDYRADIRMSFVNYVDGLARDGQISEALASRVTL